MSIKHYSDQNLEQEQLFLFVNETPIAFATSASMDVTTEEIDISNKMTGDWAAAMPGKKSFTISSESLLTRLTGAMSYDALLEKQIAGETLDFFFGHASVTDKSNTGGIFSNDKTKKNYTGKVMITSLSLKSDNGQIATCSASFKGIGGLSLDGTGGGSNNPGDDGGDDWQDPDA